MSVPHPELMKAYNKEKAKRPSERILMVHNVLNEDMKIPAVAKVFNKSYNTVKNCCNRFIKHGIKGLYDAPRSGRPPKIKNETLDKYIGDTSKGVDLPILIKKLSEEYSAEYSESGMRNKAYLMGWSCKKPQPAPHHRATVEYTTGWCYETGVWLDELEKDRFDAGAADQHLVHNDYKPRRRMWSAIGVPVWRPKYELRSKFYIFGGFTLSGRQLFRNIGDYTAENVLTVIKEMHRKWGQFGLIWDKASQHRAHIVTDYLADHASDIRVRWFPVAWPELDPVERYWSKLMRHPVMNEIFDTIDERIRKIMNVVRTMKANMNMRKILTESTLTKKIPGDTEYFDLKSLTVTTLPLTPAYIARCKNFLA